METGASLSYLEKAPSPPLPGGIPILVEGKDGQYVPSGDYFHPDQVSKVPSVPQAEFDMLKHQYVCSIEHRKELESKNRDLTSRLNELDFLYVSDLEPIWLPDGVTFLGSGP